MTCTKKNIRWIRETAKNLAKLFQLKFKVIENGHIKLIFYDSCGNHCLIVLPKSPSSRNSRIKTIERIRKELKSKFEIQINNDLFTLQ
jgi:hypothetical protein